MFNFNTKIFFIIFIISSALIFTGCETEADYQSSPKRQVRKPKPKKPVQVCNEFQFNSIAEFDIPKLKASYRAIISLYNQQLTNIAQAKQIVVERKNAVAVATKTVSGYQSLKDKALIKLQKAFEKFLDLEQEEISIDAEYRAARKAKLALDKRKKELKQRQQELKQAISNLKLANTELHNLEVKGNNLNRKIKFANFAKLKKEMEQTSVVTARGAHGCNNLTLSKCKKFARQAAFDEAVKKATPILINSETVVLAKKSGLELKLHELRSQSKAIILEHEVLDDNVIDKGIGYYYRIRATVKGQMPPALEKKMSCIKSTFAQEQKDALGLETENTQVDSPVVVTQSPPRLLAHDTFVAKKVFRDTLKDGSQGPEMVWIPKGSFKMGSENGDSDEKPVHKVFITQNFAMGKFEVTFEEYDKFAEATGKDKPSDSGWGRGNRPVINVSWNDATAYAKWLSDETGKNYRLPTEAEWEYAARAGTTTKYWWGDKIGSNNANCRNKYCGDSFEYTAPVGSFEANPFGIYDTVGNVWEWVSDIYSSDYYKTSPPRNPTGPSTSRDRAVRGGAWYGAAQYARTANRNAYSPVDRYIDLGFRLARMMP